MKPCKAAQMQLAMLLLTGGPTFSAAKSVADYVVPCVDDSSELPALTVYR